jgi:hypothetical protein
LCLLPDLLLTTLAAHENTGEEQAGCRQQADRQHGRYRGRLVVDPGLGHGRRVGRCRVRVRSDVLDALLVVLHHTVVVEVDPLRSSGATLRRADACSIGLWRNPVVVHQRAVRERHVVCHDRNHQVSGVAERPVKDVGVSRNVPARVVRPAGVVVTRLGRDVDLVRRRRSSRTHDDVRDLLVTVLTTRVVSVVAVGVCPDRLTSRGRRREDGVGELARARLDDHLGVGAGRQDVGVTRCPRAVNAARAPVAGVVGVLGERFVARHRGVVRIDRAGRSGDGDAQTDESECHHHDSGDARELARSRLLPLSVSRQKSHFLSFVVTSWAEKNLE